MCGTGIDAELDGDGGRLNVFNVEAFRNRKAPEAGSNLIIRPRADTPCVMVRINREK